MHSPDFVDPDAAKTPSCEQAIRERAYELYEQRGREDGRAEEDWFQAELEILSGSHQQKAA
jgi:Protein of unknown function (DUF2934)